MKTKSIILFIIVGFGFGGVGWWLGHRAPQTARRTPLYYQHPMRPDVHSPSPAKDEMGMDYIPVYQEKTTGTESHFPGRATVEIPSNVANLIQVKTFMAEVRPLARSLTTYGTVAFDPLLYNAISEYREAVRAQEAVKQSPLSEVRDRAASFVEAAKLKLKLSGLNPDQIRNERGLLLNEKGKAVWVYAEIYEPDMASVHPGLASRITSPAIPGKEYAGQVRSVDPNVNPVTRTARARIEIQNSDEKLKPEMFVDVAIEIPFGSRLSVPVAALFDTGEKEYVFVESTPGMYVPRLVESGVRSMEFVEILTGLKTGERVVTNANYMVDSESRFRAVP